MGGTGAKIARSPSKIPATPLAGTLWAQSLGIPPVHALQPGRNRPRGGPRSVVMPGPSEHGEPARSTREGPDGPTQRLGAGRFLMPVVPGNGLIPLFDTLECRFSTLISGQCDVGRPGGLHDRVALEQPPHLPV